MVDFFPDLPTHLAADMGIEAYNWTNYMIQALMGLLFIVALFQIGAGLLGLARAHLGNDKRRSVGGSLDAIARALEKPADYTPAKE